MATLEQLEQAFIAADEAGETEDAQAFAEEIQKLRSAKSEVKAPEESASIGSQIGAVGDLILSAPSFIANAIGTPIIAGGYAVAGVDEPFALAKEAMDKEVNETTIGKFAAHPIKSMTNYDDNTMVDKVFDWVGKKIEGGGQAISEKTGADDLGEGFKQVANLAMLAVPHAMMKKKAKPASIDDILNEIDTTKPEVKPEAPEPSLPEKYKGQAELPFAEEIQGRERQQDLFFDQVAEKLDSTSNQGELFKSTKEPIPEAVEAQVMPEVESAPLGGTGKKGFGQGGAVDLGAFRKDRPLEQTAKTKSFEDWSKDFYKQKPEFKDNLEVAKQVYDKLQTTQPINKVKPDSMLSKGLNQVLKGLDYTTGVVSTRLKNESPEVMQRAVNFEHANISNTGKRLLEADKFLHGLNKLPEPVKELLNNKLYDNNLDAVSQVSKQTGKGLDTHFEKVKAVLTELGLEQKKLGIITNMRENYFPNMVKDLDGLYKDIGKNKAEPLEAALKKAEVSAQAKGGTLSPVERTKIINRYIRNPVREGTKPGHTKERVYDSVPSHLRKHYYTPTEALDTYIRSATNQIEMAKFFGKHRVIDPKTKQVDLIDSIGNLTKELVDSKKISYPQVTAISDLLHSRFGPGNRSPNILTQTYKDIVNATTLGDVQSGLVQITDIPLSTQMNGVVPTIQAVVQTLTGKNTISAKSMGLQNLISEEFVGQRATTRAVNKIFKYNTLGLLDELGKTVILNASKINMEKAANKLSPEHRLVYEYKERFGDSFPQLVADLKAKKRTELTDQLYFSELASRQPISKLEQTQFHLDNPNIGRSATTLKSFMLKQADIIRNESYNQIKKGETIRGSKNLAKLGVLLSAAQISTDVMRAYLSNKPIDEYDSGKIALAMFKTFGYNEYFSDDLANMSFGKATYDLVAPPSAIKPFEYVAQDLKAEFDNKLNTKAKYKWVKNVPLIGKEVYGQMDAGKAERRRLEAEQQRKKFRKMIDG
jgi:hypothetical protein